MVARRVQKTPTTRAAVPISFTQAGAFHAAKKRPMKRRVMTIIPAGPPETKRVNRSVKGNMANTFLSLTIGFGIP